MRLSLIIECEHGRFDAEHWENRGTFWCPFAQYHTDPDAILEALAEAGVLQREELRYVSPKESRYVSPWKNVK